MNEAEAGIMQPDSVLPCQVPDLASWPARAHWGRVERDPYRKLVLAVVERAYLDATGNSRISVRNPSRNGRQGWGHYHHRLRRMKRLDAIYWFRSESEAVFSWRWCCLMLGYEPNTKRRIEK